MSWNYRLVKKSTPSGEEIYEFIEAYYDNGKITHYTDTGIFAESEEGVVWLLEVLKGSLSKPVLTETTILGSE